jgi:diguanylate cyclase (GGDEF)-like protein
MTQRLSLLAISACAVVVAAAAFSGARPTGAQWLGYVVLASLGALGALDVVSFLAPKDDSPRTRGIEIDITDIFFVAAVLLLPLPLVALVSAPSFVVEQIRYRRPLYRLVANAAAFVIVLVVTSSVFRLVAGPAADERPGLAWLLAAGVAAVVHLAASLAWLLYARWSMRRLRPRLSDLREIYPLADELAIKSTGVLLAALWALEPVLSVLAVGPVLVIHRLLYFRHVEAASRRDGKTGLYHAGYFRDVGERYVSRARRRGEPLALVLGDLDHLRDLNNTHGHLAGDIVIEGIAEILRTSVRDGDIVCRFGGEEFAILLPGADAAVAMRVAERIRRRVAVAAFDVGGGTSVRVTLSSGVSLVGPGVDNLTDLVTAADTALYAAKHAGRNCSVAA